MNQIILRVYIIFAILCSYHVVIISALSLGNNVKTRRQWMNESLMYKYNVMVGGLTVLDPSVANAAADEKYDNPNMPAGPEERCKQYNVRCIPHILCI